MKTGRVHIVKFQVGVESGCVDPNGNIERQPATNGRHVGQGGLSVEGGDR